MISLEFILTSIVVVLLPGTGVIYTLAVGIGLGFRASVFAALGCTLGIIPSAFAAIIGLSALLHTSAVAFQLIKFAGVIYLFYMAWSILKQNGSLSFESEGSENPKSNLALIASGALLNVLNPKLSLFFLAFLPQFIDAKGGSSIMNLIVLASIFMALTFVIFVIYGYMASFARNYIISKPSVMLWLRRSFAASFGFLGLRLAFASDK